MALTDPYAARERWATEAQRLREEAIPERAVSIAAAALGRLGLTVGPEQLDLMRRTIAHGARPRVVLTDPDLVVTVTVDLPRAVRLATPEATR